MSELRSKCCGGRVKWEADTLNTYTNAGFPVNVWVCQKCHRPTEVEAKDMSTKLDK